MIIDEILLKSFSLDYEILKNDSFFNHYNNLNSEFLNPKIKTNDLFKEFEDYVKETRERFNLMTKLFEECNEQRKNMRVVLLKILKEKSSMDRLIVNEKNELLLKKMNVHEELRIKIIDELSDKLMKANKETSLLKLQMNKLIANYKCLDKQTQIKNSKNHRETQKIINERILNSSSMLNNNLDAKSNNSPTNKKNLTNPPPTTTDNSFIVTDTTFSSKNVKFSHVENIDVQLKNLLSFDFNEEKYNIISSSPISTPKALREKQAEIIKDDNLTINKPKKDTNLNIKRLKKISNPELKIRNKYKSVNNSPEKDLEINKDLYNTERHFDKNKFNKALINANDHIVHTDVTKKISDKGNLKLSNNNKYLEDKIKDNLEKLRLLKNPANNNIKETKKPNKIQSQTSRWTTPRNNHNMYNTIDNENLISSSIRNK